MADMKTHTRKKRRPYGDGMADNDIYISISDVDEDEDLTLSRVDEWVGKQ